MMGKKCGIPLEEQVPGKPCCHDIVKQLGDEVFRSGTTKKKKKKEGK